MVRAREKGIAGEDLAIDYLREKGYRIIQRNYRYEHAEVDIIAETGDILVFTEVKAFRSKKFGEPEDSVTERKRARVRRAADGYIFENSIDDKMCRFDVIAIDYRPSGPVIRHIEDAF